MNRKSFVILLAVVCVFVVLAIVGQGRRPGTGSIAGDSAGTLLVPALTEDLADVDEILIDGAGRERLVSLERSVDDWTIRELDGYEADRNAVNALLISIAEARIVEEKTADPAFHSRLGVEAIDDADAGGLAVTLVADGGRYAVVLGAGYGDGQRYARVADENLSVLIDRDPEIPEEPADWADTEIIDVAADRVQRVEIRHADGETLVMQKPTRDEANFTVEGIPEGRELQYAAVANVTGSLLEDLRLDDVRRGDGEAAEPVAVTEFRTFDGLIVSVTATGSGDADPWLTFSAAFDPEQALAFATGTPGAEPAGAAQEEPAPEAPEAVPDAVADAEAIDARLAGWQYRIPSYQLGQLTRRMEDLLRAETGE